MGKYTGYSMTDYNMDIGKDESRGGVLDTGTYGKDVEYRVKSLD